MFKYIILFIPFLLKLMTGLIVTGVVLLSQLPVSCIQATDTCSNMCTRIAGEGSWACTKMACAVEQDAKCLASTNDIDIQEPIPILCTADYTPVCGEKQVQCITAPCDPIRQTYGNACMAAADQATVVSEGECESTSGAFVGGDKDEHGCLIAAGYSWNANKQQCTRPWEDGPIAGGDKDEHGCIGSAGYSWDPASQQCVRSWEPQGIVAWAHNLGITKFATIADFNWDALVTREQAAKMIMVALDNSGVDDRMIKQSAGSCVWTDSDLIDSSLLSMVQKSCSKGLFYGYNHKFMPQEYLTDTDVMTVLTRASQYIPALADIMMRSKFAVTDKPMTRGDLISRLQNIVSSVTTSDPA